MKKIEKARVIREWLEEHGAVLTSSVVISEADLSMMSPETANALIHTQERDLVYKIAGEMMKAGVIKIERTTLSDDLGMSIRAKVTVLKP